MRKIMITAIVFGVLSFVACGPKHENQAAKKGGKGGKGSDIVGKASEKSVDVQGLEQKLKGSINDGAISRESDLYPFYQMLNHMGIVFDETWRVLRSVDNDRGTSTGQRNPFNQAKEIIANYYKNLDNEDSVESKSLMVEENQDDKTANQSKKKSKSKSVDKNKSTRKYACNIEDLRGKVDVFVDDSGAGKKVLTIGKCTVDPKSNDSKSMAFAPLIKIILQSSGEFSMKIRSTDFVNPKSPEIKLDEAIDYGLGSVMQFCATTNSEVCKKIRGNMNCSGQFDSTQYSLTKMDCENLVKEFDGKSSFVFNKLNYNANENDIWNFLGNRIEVSADGSGVPVAVQEIKPKEALRAGAKTIDLIIKILIDPELEKKKKAEKKEEGDKRGRNVETPPGKSLDNADVVQEEGLQSIPANPNVDGSDDGVGSDGADAGEGSAAEGAGARDGAAEGNGAVEGNRGATENGNGAGSPSEGNGKKKEELKNENGQNNAPAPTAKVEDQNRVNEEQARIAAAQEQQRKQAAAAAEAEAKAQSDEEKRIAEEKRAAEEKEAENKNLNALENAKKDNKFAAADAVARELENEFARAREAAKVAQMLASAKENEYNDSNPVIQYFDKDDLNNLKVAADLALEKAEKAKEKADAARAVADSIKK